MSRYRLPILVGAIFLLGGVILISDRFADPARAERIRLQHILDTRGAAEAYEAFRTEYAADPRKNFHNLGHWLGAEIYRTEGPRGLVLCDETAGYGCFHGFFGAAYQKEDEEFLAATVGYCGPENVNIRSIECVHGIGHGYLSLVGYGDDSLVRAIDSCRKLPAPEFLKGVCTSGVFMEYNIRTMQETAQGEFAVRELDPQHPYHPCPSLPSSYRLDCYRELPYWWAAAGTVSAGESGSLCAQAPQGQEECFRGIGRLLPWLHRDIAKIAGECRSMPQAEAVRFCVEDAAKRLLFRTGYSADEMCDALPSADARQCRGYINSFRCANLGMCDE